MAQLYFRALGNLLSRGSWVMLCIVAVMMAILLVWMTGSYLKDLWLWHRNQKNGGDAK